MALVLLLLLFGLRLHRPGPIVAAIAMLLLNMIFPQLLRPLAVVWFGLSHVIGTVMSKILLTIVFFVIVTPIGLFRKTMGKDSLGLRSFKASKQSAMLARNHTFIGPDMEKPY